MISTAESASKNDASEAAGLYLHVPFCSAICPYCAFAVRVGREDAYRRFVETLLLEIRSFENDAVFSSIRFDTIYFGGGTPSLLSRDDLHRLLEALNEVFSLHEPTIFFEANPEDVDDESLVGWRELGVSMLSLGVQSFDDDALRFLGRRHDGEASTRAAEKAMNADFATVSIDLIYGLPDQGAASWRRDLERALDLEPDHLSAYELEIHEGTTFGKRHARGELRELAEDVQGDLFLLTHEMLRERDWDVYEVSNFARTPEHRSRHNQKYWRHVPYLGLGPSAHSYDGERRWWNERLLPRWEKCVRSGSSPIIGEERLSAEDRALETLMLGLRTAEGVDLATLRERDGVDLIALNVELLDDWRRDDLARIDDGRLRATIRGFAVADRLAASLDLS